MFIGRVLDGASNCDKVSPDGQIVQEILNGLHTAVSQVIRGQLNQRAMDESETSTWSDSCRPKKRNAHRARKAELKAATPLNFKGLTLLFNEQPSPVMPLTP